MSLLVVAAICTGCASQPEPKAEAVRDALTSAAPEPITFRGDVDITEPLVVRTLPNNECEGTRPVQYLNEGAQVTVSDQAGVVVGAGVLTAGRTDAGAPCQFTFSFEVKPADFYVARVAQSESLTFSREQVTTSRCGFTFG